MKTQKSFEEREEDLQTIREWLNKQPHLPKNIDDQYLRRFLYACNFSLEQTKYVIDLCFTIRSQVPEIFSERDPKSDHIQQVLENIDMVPLPKLTKENYRIFIYRLATSDPDKYHFVHSIKTFFMVADVRLVSEKEFPDGEVPIFDMNGYSLRHLAKITLPILKKYMLYSQEAHPVRLKQIHIINTPPFLDRCIALLKPLMKSEVALMLHFHTPNSTTLNEYIPQELLPEEYGGKVGKLADLKAEWVQRVMDHRDFFLDDTKWKVDESKRPTETAYGKQFTNMQGSFRTLNID